MKRAAKRARIKAVRAQQKVNYDVNRLVNLEVENILRQAQDAEKERDYWKKEAEKLKAELKKQKLKTRQLHAKVRNLISTAKMRMKGIGISDLFGKAGPTYRANVTGPFSGMLGNKGLETVANIINHYDPTFFQKATQFIDKFGLSIFCDILSKYFEYGERLDYTFDAFQLREEGYEAVLNQMDMWEQNYGENDNMGSQYD